MRTIIHATLLIAAIAGAASAQCGANGSVVFNPFTGKMGCTGKVGSAGYKGTFTSATTLTVTAATHGQGTSPWGVCYDNATPANLITQTANYPQVAANGDITFAWTGSLTGYCLVTSLGMQQGPAGATGPTGPAGATGNSVAFNATPQAVTSGVTTSVTVPFNTTISDASQAVPSCVVTSGGAGTAAWSEYVNTTTQMVIHFDTGGMTTAPFTGTCTAVGNGGIGLMGIGNYAAMTGSSPNTNAIWLLTGVGTAGLCDNSSGTAYSICSWNGSSWVSTSGSGSGGGAAHYWFQGTAQAGASAFALNFSALTNLSYTTVDSTHLRAQLQLATGATGAALYTITPVTSTNPSVTFDVEVSSTDAVNAGSMALSYACVAAGASVDNPTPVALTAVSLTTIASTKSVYQSTQSVTCTGTSASPADLYVWWTPTAPSGGTMNIIRLGVSY